MALRLGSQKLPTFFIGKWTIEILSLLKERSYRHGQLRHRLGRISQRMLTRSLRNLESAGLIARQVTRLKPLVVEYSLTKPGRAFIIPLKSICRWADRQNVQLSAVVHLSQIHEKQP